MHTSREEEVPVVLAVVRTVTASSGAKTVASGGLLVGTKAVEEKQGAARQAVERAALEGLVVLGVGGAGAVADAN